MTDQQPEQQQQPQADPDAAYEAALTGEEGRDQFGLPAKQTTHIGGQSIGAAEQEARQRLAAIEALKGQGATEAGEQQPAEHPAEQQPEQQGVEGPLSAADVASFLLGPDEAAEPLTEEEAAFLEQQEAERQLVSGEATAAAVGASREYDAAIGELIDQSPGIDTEEAVEAMTPGFERIAAAYGDEVASHPDIIRQLYEQTGGAERWGAVAHANAEASAYENALSGGDRPRDAFGFFVDSESDEF